MIGRIVGNYKIIQALGEGGVGMVYKGIDTMLDREVAIKVLRPELASQTSIVERFRSEAVTLAKLNHPNIATLFSLFRDGQDLLMVLEFLKGETLDHTLYRRGKIPTEEAIPIFCQGLEGINYAHKLGIVHRDIKPGNMMLTEEGILKVLDFGIARLLGSNRMTRVGNVIGTLEYMSPEQVRGHETDARSDIYGMGIMLYEMLTGKLPFESENDFALMKMQTENIPTPPTHLNPDIPSEIEFAIMKSVAKDPNQRFQSAGEFLEYFGDLGFAQQITSFGFGTFYGKKLSRPSNPGINSGEKVTNSTLPLVINQDNQTLPIENIPQQSQIETVQLTTNPNQNEIETAQINFIPQPTENFDIPVENKKANVAETRLAPNQNEIRGTRLATPSAPISNEMKATRLGNIESIENLGIQSNTGSTSFLSNLNWIHYTGAGAAVLFFFALITTAGVFALNWNSQPNTPKVEQQNPTPANTPAPSTQTLPQSEPAKQPTRADAGDLPSVPSDSSIVSNSNNAIPIGNPPANSANTIASQPTQRQPKEPAKTNETARVNQPSAKPQQPKPQQPKQGNSGTAKTPKEPQQSGTDLRKILEGKRGDN